MALETVSTIYDLVATNPAAGDQVSQADDHMRNIKTALLASFAGLAASPGYQKIGRAIIQWGTSTTSAAGAVTIIYPIAFPTATGSAVANVGTAGLTPVIMGVDTTSATQLVVHSTTPAGVGTAVGFAWIAVGY